MMNWRKDNFCALLAAIAALHIIVTSTVTQGTTDLKCPATVVSQDEPNQVRFFLWSPPNCSSIEVAYKNNASRDSSAFNVSLTTIVIIHGFNNPCLDNASTFPGILVSAYCQRFCIHPYNIIVVDWRSLSNPSGGDLSTAFYPCVISNVDIVGDRVAEFLVWLYGGNNSKLRTVRLIGHSMGAHICGRAGQKISALTGAKVARIDGLDAANPGFVYPDASILAHTLGPSDAVFVVVSHACAGTYGALLPLGTLDIYINGGSLQPGCTDPNHPGCCHIFAYQFYAQTVRQDDQTCRCACSAFILGSILLTVTSCCQEKLVIGENVNSNSTGVKYVAFQLNNEKNPDCKSVEERKMTDCKKD